jgi:hypothetical protein
MSNVASVSNMIYFLDIIYYFITMIEIESNDLILLCFPDKMAKCKLRSIGKKS